MKTNSPQTRNAGQFLRNSDLPPSLLAICQPLDVICSVIEMICNLVKGAGRVATWMERREGRAGIEDRKASIRKRARRKADDCRRQRLSGRTDDGRTGTTGAGAYRGGRPSLARSVSRGQTNVTRKWKRGREREETSRQRRRQRSKGRRRRRSATTRDGRTRNDGLTDKTN